MSSPELLLHQYREAGKAYAKAKADAAYLDHYRHVVLSHQMALAEEKGAKSVAAQDRDARNSPEYLTHLKGLHTAVQAESLRKTDLQAAEYEIEIWRTTEASKRFERKAYNHEN